MIHGMVLMHTYIAEVSVQTLQGILQELPTVSGEHVFIVYVSSL